MHRPLFMIKILITEELACLMMLTVQIWVSISPLNQIAVLLPRTCSKINVIQIITFVDTVWNHLNNININFCKHKIIYSMGLSSAQRLFQLTESQKPLSTPDLGDKNLRTADSHTQLWAGPRALHVLWARSLCALCDVHTHTCLAAQSQPCHQHL